MSDEHGERIARLEGRVEDMKGEVERVRVRQHDLTGSIGLISQQVAAIGAEVHGMTANASLIAENAAQRVLTAYVAAKAAEDAIDTRDKEAGLANNLTKALLAALALTSAILGLKAGNVIP